VPGDDLRFKNSRIEEHEMSITQEQQNAVLAAVQQHFVAKRNDNALKAAVETAVGHSVDAQTLIAAVDALCVVHSRGGRVERVEGYAVKSHVVSEYGEAAVEKFFASIA
jgi:hypothetical protein